MDGAQFDLELPPLTPRENSCLLNSSEKYSFAEGFSQIQHQYSVKSSSLNMSSPSVQSLCAHSAFAVYVKAGPIAAFESATGDHSLHKNCFRFLSSIQEGKSRAEQISGLNAPASGNNNKFQKARTHSAFEHMIAERNRRIRLKQHFSNLYSLLPKKSKRDKYSILTNTISYLKELKLRVIQLEQQNQNLLKLVPKSFPNAG